MNTALKKAISKNKLANAQLIFTINAAATGLKGSVNRKYSKTSYKITQGQKFQKVENDENRFFAITSSKLFKN